MKITVMSDLHLEFSDIVLTNEQGADVLVLSGDICIAADLHDHPAADFNPYAMGAFKALGEKQKRVKTYRDFFKMCSDTFPHVVYVMGNHEFYHGKFFASVQHMREEFAEMTNLHFLERDAVKINGVTFVGGTLWTNMNKGDPLTLHSTRDMMNDFRLIRNDEKGFRPMSPMDTAIRHRETIDYIRQVVRNVRDREDPTERVVVVGHHTPSFKSCAPEYAHDTLMNGAYHSDLSEFILDHPEIVLWTHGHTHHVFDYEIGSCRVVCNPRGYVSDGYAEDTGWDQNMIVEI